MGKNKDRNSTSITVSDDGGVTVVSHSTNTSGGSSATVIGSVTGPVHVGSGNQYNTVTYSRKDGR